MRQLLFLVLFLYMSVASFAYRDDHELGQTYAVDSLNQLADNLYHSYPDSARKLSIQALLLAKQSKYVAGIGMSYRMLGLSYWAQSFNSMSVFYLNAALPFFKNDKLNQALCYSSIARNYADLRKVAAADSLFKKAEALAGNNPHLHCQIATDRSFLYLINNAYDKGIAEANRAMSLAIETDNQSTIAILYARLVALYLAKGNYTKAEVLMDTAYQLSIENNNSRLRVTNLSRKAYALRMQRKYAQSIPFLKEALQVADSANLTDLASNACLDIVEAYKQLNEPSIALAYQKTYQELQDTLHVQNKQNNFQLIEDYTSLEKTLDDIEALQENKARNEKLLQSQKVAITFLVVSLLLLLVLLSISYHSYKQKQQLASQLHQHNRETLQQKDIILQQAEHLKQLNASKDRIIGVIGHDLRTPLMNLRSLVELFQEGVLSSAELQEMVKQLLPAINSAEFTLSNLMNWAISQKDGSPVKTKPVQLTEVISEAEKIFEYALRQKNLQLVCRFNTNDKAFADENHIKSIVHNLLNNAIKFTPANREILVELNRKRNALCLEVKDQGVGMSKVFVNQLFTFDTLTSTMGTQGEKGTGLGLLLCYDLIRLNGGKLWVHSEPGKGSTFFVQLPLA